MKRWGCLAAVLTLNAAAQDTLVLQDLQAAPGAAARWPVALKGASPVTGLQFDISYTAGQLTVTAAAPAGATPVPLTAAREIAPGKTRVVVSNPGNQPLTKGVVLDAAALIASGAPAGGPGFAVSNVILALADGTRVSAPGVEYGPVSAWKTQYFTPAELAAGLITGDDADPDGDGIPNLLEYGTGGNPRLPGAGERPVAGVVTRVVNGSLQMVLTMDFRQAIAAPGITLTPEVSENLLLWSPGPAAVATGAGNGTSVPMRVEVPAGDAREKFLRLKVTRKATP